MNENGTKMTDSIPQIDGPKLSPFRGAIEDIEFKEYLGPSITRYESKDNALNHVFRVHIEGKEYCLKVFEFISLEQLWLSAPSVPDDYRRLTDNLVRYSLDPFYAECRAFGRLEEEGENGSIAVQCYGYIFLSQAIEHQIQTEFNINWCRQPEHKGIPLRAILKDYLRSDMCRGEQLCAMRSKLEKLNDMGIFNMNIREENYGRGLLIDFGMAITVPHLRLVDDLRSRVEIFRDARDDRIEFDRMARRIRKDGPNPRKHFTTQSPQNIARASYKGASNNESDDEWEPRESDDNWESEESDDEPESEEIDEWAVPPLNNSTGLVEDLGSLQKSKYLQLLSQVISAAREARFLRQDNFDMSTMKVAIGDVGRAGDGDDDNTKLRSDLGAGYKKMIRAAGELYVFVPFAAPLYFSTNIVSQVYELLLTNVGLPLSCWKSKIKQYVTEHPKYAKMEPWTGDKTANFVYFDVDNSLSTLLIDGGYLEKRWAGKSPTYYIDVKTTTGGCDDPFLMSKSQNERASRTSSISSKMKLTTNGPGGLYPHDRIYIIFRVYNFGKKSIGYTIYVDPEALRIKGALELTVERWAVQLA
ncbi:hypothetical protein FHL15_000421 [Xylaria flabelliformis]|uniref:Protein kinase domain-containing protein n=1 Tax=Xylaria flabelliformis TaxID=2512241 RepID=A0A553IFU1_9PEZI|nr:hypothetical protein FHL15_000421 [Xylaria flabelliformis]